MGTPTLLQCLQAFDGRSGSKWLDFGGSKGAWVEVAVVAPAHSAEITSYHLTAAQDAEERDPATWKLEGLPWQPAADPLSGAALRGTHQSPPPAWLLLDEQRDILFAGRGSTLTFQVRVRYDRRIKCSARVYSACLSISVCTCLPASLSVDTC